MTDYALATYVDNGTVLLHLYNLIFEITPQISSSFYENKAQMPAM